MKKHYFLIVLIACNFSAFSQSKKELQSELSKQKMLNDSLVITIENILKEKELEKVSYALGVSMAQNLQQQNFDFLIIEALSKGFQDVYNQSELLVKKEEANEVIQNYFKAKAGKLAIENLEAGKKFMEENKTKEGVVTLASGLQYQVITEGTGDTPSLESKVTTHYHGTLIDGTVFDSSVDRDQPASFPVSGVIPGWTEALQLMKVGSKWKLFIPAELAYGPNSPGGAIGPNSTLIFDVELISIDL